MRTTTYVTRLNHRRDVVSSFLSDLRNDSVWRQEILAVEVLSGTPGESGCTYRETVVWEGIRSQAVLSTPEVVPGSRLVVSTTDPGYESRYEYQFVPFDGGCEVTLFMSIDTSGPLKLIEPFTWAMITRWVERDLDNLDSALSSLSAETVEAPSEAADLEHPSLYNVTGLTSRAFLGEVVDNLSEGILLFSREGRIFYANRAVEATLGIPHDSVVGRCYDDPAFRMRTLDGQLISPEDLAVARVLHTGEAVLESEYMVDVDGGPPLVISENVVPLMVDGELMGAASSITVVSERVQAEAELRESEERFRAIVEQTQYGIVISAPDGEILVYNHAMEELTGHSEQEVKEKGWLEAAFPDPEARAQIAEHALRSSRGELPYFEQSYRRADGEVIWVSYSASPIRLKGRDYVFAIINDVTERKEAELQVQYQSRLLNEVHNAVIATDMRGRIVYVNEAAERLFGQGKAKMLGDDVMDILRPRSVEPQSTVWAGVMGDGEWEGEAVFARPGGDEVPILLSLSLLTDEDGQPDGLVGVAADITDLKAAEKALKEKDRAIRQAYVDVVGAVTGGKLVLMTDDELRGALGAPVDSEKELTPDRLAQSRHEVVEYMATLPLKVDPETAVVAYGEAATNALKHANGGCYQLFRKNGMLQVGVRDAGKGIDFRMLPRATLLAGFSSTQTLGMGFTIMLDLADRVLLATGPEGTEIVLEFAII